MFNTVSGLGIMLSSLHSAMAVNDKILVNRNTYS